MEENFQLEKEKYKKNTNNKKETTIKPGSSDSLFETIYKVG